MHWYNCTPSIGMTQKVMTSFYAYHFKASPTQRRNKFLTFDARHFHASTQMR